MRLKSSKTKDGVASAALRSKGGHAPRTRSAMPEELFSLAAAFRKQHTTIWEQPLHICGVDCHSRMDTRRKKKQKK